VASVTSVPSDMLKNMSLGVAVMKRNSAGLLHQQEMKDDLDFVTFRKYTEVICLLINEAY